MIYAVVASATTPSIFQESEIHRAMPDHALIVGQDLNDAEREKLERLNSTLTTAFAEAGYSGVSICQGSGVGEFRTLRFMQTANGPSVIALSSLAFLVSTRDELHHLIANHLRARPPGNAAEGADPRLNRPSL